MCSSRSINSTQDFDASMPMLTWLTLGIDSLRATLLSQTLICCVTKSLNRSLKAYSRQAIGKRTRQRLRQGLLGYRSEYGVLHQDAEDVRARSGGALLIRE